MKNKLLKIVQITGGWNYKETKAIIYHPIPFLIFIILFPIVLIMCLFVDENIIDAVKDNFTFKIK